MAKRQTKPGNILHFRPDDELNDALGVAYQRHIKTKGTISMSDFLIDALKKVFCPKEELIDGR